ncbi:hypothetical protein PG996_005484 [Apiospora saccharicola]|uniref:DUF2306 domain-containing protein n=1 Tax=Apiospora saccharicola TaxID=335842 RepID=A0ABR1VLL7_9PEZI
MGEPSRPPANGFVAAARKVYNPVGFSKGYNFILWFIFGGAFLGFLLARLPYLNLYGVYCSPNPNGALGAPPGECYYYLNFDRYKVGIMLHLYGILFAGLLACLQFTPIIRYKALILHRIGGWLAILLSLVGIVGALMIARRAFGGGMAAQAITGVMAIAFLGSLLLAVINIKRLQIEEHRKWMLRAWFYAGAIITMRIILIIAVNITAPLGDYYYAMPCGKVAFTVGSDDLTLALYPACASYFNGTKPNQWTMVTANFAGTDVAQIAAALDITAGMALWLAFIIHAVGIEIYIHLTPAEHHRLRGVSYQRQKAAGMRNPGRAGLTADRLGDSEKWMPLEAAEADNKERAADASKDSLPAPSD